MKKIILASTSPRRLEILENLGIIFECISPEYEENIIGSPFSYKLVEDSARKKGESVLNKISVPSLIISADTVVIANDTILGKPKDFEDAFNMLKMLNNISHKVVTSVCLIDTEKNKKIIKSETSEVEFNKLSDEQIKNYINEFKPFDKAGAYGIQELSPDFIKNINGEYDNIVGLPSKLLIKMISQIMSESV